MNPRLVVSLLFALLTLRSNTFGQPNLIQNGSFENGLTAWTSSGVGLFLGFGGAADGGNFANIQGGGLVYQDFATTPGAIYHLRFAMAGNINWPGPITMDTLWGSNVVAQTTWNPAGHNINNLGWIYTDLDLTASGSQTRLTFENPGALNQQPFLDAISVVQVPEPSNILLLGLAGLVALKRRRPSLGYFP